MSAHSAGPRRLRLAATGLGLVYFFWIPFEDTQAGFAILLAAATCGLLAAGAVFRWQGSNRMRPGHAAGVGLLAGLAVSPVTVALMAIKTGLHGHSVPDFSPQQIIDVLLLTPAWALAGTLIGLGIWLFARRAAEAS